LDRLSRPPRLLQSSRLRCIHSASSTVGRHPDAGPLVDVLRQFAPHAPLPGVLDVRRDPVERASSRSGIASKKLPILLAMRMRLSIFMRTGRPCPCLAGTAGPAKAADAHLGEATGSDAAGTVFHASGREHRSKAKAATRYVRWRAIRFAPPQV